MDFVGRIDGVAFDGGTAQGVQIDLGNSNLIPGFDGQLTGAKAGENRDVKVTFPTDYPTPNIAGKDAPCSTSR